MNTKTALQSDRSPGGQPKTYDIATKGDSQKLVPVRGIKGLKTELYNPDIRRDANIPDEIKYKR